MVRHDFGCPRLTCDAMVFDVTVDTANPEDPAIPSCPAHGDKMIIQYVPKRYQPFAAFDLEVGGPTEESRVVHVSTLEQLRRIEADSVRRWERGEPGAQPVIVRNLSQDRSNRDANVFQKRHPQVPRDQLVTRNKRGIPFITSRSGPPIPCDED